MIPSSSQLVTGVIPTPFLSSLLSSPISSICLSFPPPFLVYSICIFIFVPLHSLFSFSRPMTFYFFIFCRLLVFHFDIIFAISSYMYFTYEIIYLFLAFLCSGNLHFGYSVSVMCRSMTKMQCVVRINTDFWLVEYGAIISWWGCKRRILVL